MKNIENIKKGIVFPVIKRHLKKAGTAAMCILMALMSFAGPGTDIKAFASDDVLQIRSFTAALRSGAQMKDGDWVWEADTQEADHRFTFRITYSLSGTFEYGPGDIEIRVPDKLLRDRDGNYADYIEAAVPEEGDPEINERTEFVCHRDGGELIITNRAELPAAQNGFIEVSFLTSKKTMAYLDHGASGSGSDGFTAKIRVKHGTEIREAETEPIIVYIDTGAEITGIEKRPPNLYKCWQASWGDAVKPAYPSNYYYLIWEVRSRIDMPTQPYNFSLEDSLSSADEGVVLGFRMQGEEGFRPESKVDNIMRPAHKEYDERYDYVLTAHPKEHFDQEDLEVRNYVTGCVDPIDQADQDSFAGSNRKWIYRKPVFTVPEGHFMLWKRGNDFADRSVRSSEDIRDFSLNEFKSKRSDTIENLRFHVEQTGYPYPWTIDGDPEDPSSYGKRPVTYEIWDNVLTLNDDDAPLRPEDYELSSLKYEPIIKDAVFDDENKVFRPFRVSFDEEDRIDLWLEHEGEWKKAGYLHLKTDVFNIESALVTEAEEGELDFGPGVTGFKAVMQNPYYMTDLHFYPYFRIKRSELTERETEGKDKVWLNNTANSRILDSEGNEIVTFRKTDTDYIIGTQKDGHLVKRVKNYSNNKARKLYTLTWGASLSEDFMDPEAKRINTLQSSGTFYDLLPLGGTYVEDSVEVRADKEVLEEGAYEIKIRKNFRGSGRDLLVVSVLESGSVYELSYKTAHTWERIKDYGIHLINDLAYETGNVSIGDGLKDTGGGVDELKDLDPDSSDEERFLYTQAKHNIDIITSANLGLYKKVKAAGDRGYVYETTTFPDSDYSYYIRFQTDEGTTAKNLIVFDSLENYETRDHKRSDWKGTLESIDTKTAELLGAEPVVYYSILDDLDPEEHHDLGEIKEGKRVWLTEDEIGDLSSAKAIAIDITKRPDGSPFVLDKDTSMSFVVNMRSPLSSGGGENTAYNNVYLQDTVRSSEGFEADFFVHQDYTKIKFRVVGDVKFHKAAADDHETPIKAIHFRLRGISDYGTEIDRESVSNNKGIVNFSKVEKGTYELQETVGDPDWIQDHRVRKVIVDESGLVTIDGETDYYFENHPRIHGDILFVKKSFPSDGNNNGRFLKNAVFRLQGTSDYGNEVLVYASSDIKGSVNFSDIEKGIYSLTEVEAPEGYILNSREYVLTIDENGNFSIKDPVGTSSFVKNTGGEYVIYNEGYHEFSLRKRDAVNNSMWLQGAEFRLTGTSDLGNRVDRTVRSNDSGRATFDYLESGLYVLKETDPPEGHMADEKEFMVEIKPDGTVEIPGLEREDITGFFIWDNERLLEGKIKIIKKWRDGLTGNAAFNRPEPRITISTVMPQAEEVMDPGRNTLTEKPGESVSGDEVSEPGESFLGEGSGNIIPPTGNRGGQAFAVFDSSDGSLCFFRDDEGAYENGQVNGTKTYYTDFESVYGYSESDLKWRDVKSSVKSVAIRQGDVITPKSMAYWFKDMSNMENCDLTGLDTSLCKSLNSTFYSCRSLTSLNVSGFDTSLVTQMNQTFRDCVKLTHLDLSGFDTSKVGTMYGMFNGCQELRNLDLSGFNTSKVTSMHYMFTDCKNLSELDLSGFDTSKVTNMSSMFCLCKGMTSLDISSFVTSSAVNMSGMFLGCVRLTELDLRNFDTSKVTNMSQMFQNCEQLLSIDMDGWDTTKLKKMDQLFKGCSLLGSLDLSGFDTSSVTDVTNFLYGCSQLKVMALGDKSLFNMGNAGLDNSGWERYATLSKMRMYDQPVLENLMSEYDGSAPGWYKVSGTIAHNEEVMGEEHISKEGDHENVEWVKESDDIWTYTFNVYDDSRLYYAWEENLAGYVSDMTIGQYKTLNDGVNDTKTVTVTNMKEGDPISDEDTGDLKITKLLAGDHSEEDAEKEFAVHIELAGRTGNEILGGVVFRDGRATVYIKPDQSFLIEDLPIGTAYRVWEEPSAEYETEYTNENGVIESGSTKEVSIVNTVLEPPEIPKNSFILKKSVKGSYGDRGRKFNFRISFSGLKPNETYEFLEGNAMESNERGELDISVMLGSDEEAVLRDIPVGAYYQITETENEYNASYVIDDRGSGDLSNIEKNKDRNPAANMALTTARETVDEGEDIIITFTNRLDLPVPTGVSAGEHGKVWLILVFMFIGILAIRKKLKYSDV